MELEILSKKENPLLDRTELRVKMWHPKEKTPMKEDVRSKIAEMMNAKKENVIVAYMKSQFGKPETVAYVKVYKNKDALMKIERNYILIRNKLIQKMGEGK